MFISSSKKQIYILSAVLVIVVGGIFIYRFVKDDHGTENRGEMPAPMSEDVPPEIEEEVAAMNSGTPEGPEIKVEEIKFTKTLLFHHDQYAVDGGGLKPLQCTTTKKTIAYFMLDSGPDRAVISCTNDYLGGVKISYEDKDGAVQELEIAQKDGDAGDIWDSRSLVVRNDKGLHIARVSLTASADPMDEEKPAECSEHKMQYKWNVQNKKFEEVPYTESFSVQDFKKPTIDSCLNADGSVKSHQ